MDYPGGDRLLEQALPVAQHIARLKATCRRLHVPVVYVNDNFGKWQSDFTHLVEHCLHGGVPGEPVARILHPEQDDYFVLKPKHSGFYATTLDILLTYLQVKTLLLVGLTGDYCVLLTASDAFLRDFRLFVPADCVASIDPSENDHALRYMQRVFRADITPSAQLDVPALIADS
jgi:nicotinamidase-related amidase